MKIAVIGAGAVGGYFGGRLALGRNEVTFLARGNTLDALRPGPLRFESIKGDFEVQVGAAHNREKIGTVDLVLIAVKAWQDMGEGPAAMFKFFACGGAVLDGTGNLTP